MAAEAAAEANPEPPERRAAQAPDAASFRRLEAAGWVTVNLPLERIGIDKMVYDRMVLVRSELDELRRSILDRGLRLPIEVCGREDGSYGFISNVLIHAVDGSGAKRARALAVLGQGGIVFAQALGEVVHVLRRKAALDLPEVAEASDALRAMLDVVPLTEAVHARALCMAAATGYSVRDASILAAAILAGCDVFLSEDMQDGRAVEGVTIRSPFG